ncbi:MAG: FKBP-type peptidyl-prolyl cis-trans isomerase [Pseudomonadota bacterium]
MKRKLSIALVTASAVALLTAGVVFAGQTMTTPSGLKVEILNQGNGPKPKAGQTVSVHYIGTLFTGRKFDSSRDRGVPISFELGKGKVIQGWDEGLALLTVGTRAKLTVPPHLGYGAEGSGGVIPPNATLIFDVELLEAK